HLEQMPVIAYFSDGFQKPIPFAPDVAVGIDEVLERKIDMLHCHVSQMYEWLPYNGGYLAEVPEGASARRTWLFGRRAPDFAATAPATQRDGDCLTIGANGTRSCTGGWQLHYTEVVPGRRYAITVEVAYDGIAQPRDVLECLAVWGETPADDSRPRARWEFLLP